MPHFVERIEIAAPVEAAWRTLADIGEIARWNPGVVASRRLDAGPAGIDAQRRCELGGGRYLDETVIEFEPRRRLTFRITGTNLPLTADIRFDLAATAGGCTVGVSPDYPVRYGLLGRLLDLLLIRSAYRTGMRRLLAGLKDDVERAQARDHEKARLAAGSDRG